jgi:hypothetical protein
MNIVFKNKIPIIISFKTCLFFKKIFGFHVGAVTLFPFIVVRDREILEKKEYINHESIHIRQYLETLIIGIIVIGLIEYLYALFILKKTRTQAYYYMGHEQEAHQNDQNLNYLKTRKCFSYYKYLNPKNKIKMDLADGKRVIL